MKETLSLLILVILSSFTLNAQDEIISIAEARTKAVGDVVTVEGIINCPDYGFNNGQFYVQDSTAGINIFYGFVGGEMGAITDYDEGDTVRINGRIELFAELLEILPNSVDIIGKGDVIPEPIQLSASDLILNSPFEGMRVQVQNVTLTDATDWPTEPIGSGSGTNVGALADNTAPFIIRIDRGQSAQEASPIPDEPFTITGILGRFNDDVQILPFYESDIMASTTTSTFETLKQSNSIKVYPNPVRSEISLEVLPQAGNVTRAALFDVVGKMVTNYGSLNVRNQTIQLPLPSQVKNGSYYLTVWTENGLRSSKITVLR